jgi:ribosome maturation factor RimP
MDPLTYDALRALVEDTASLYGLQLVELKFVPRGPRWRLRVFVDRKGGVTVRECASVSRELSRSLDAEQLISHPYVLEVSSPGVDRPLRHRRDFALVEGRRVEMHMRGGEVLRGKVVSTSDEVVTVRLPDGELRRAELGQVERAALDVSLKGR